MNKNIILIYHIPIHINSSNEIVDKKMRTYNDIFTKHIDDFYDIYVLPNMISTDEPQKIIIDTIDLKNTKNNISVKKSLEEINNQLLKIYDYNQWVRSQKLKTILNKL